VALIPRQDRRQTAMANRIRYVTTVRFELLIRISSRTRLALYMRKIPIARRWAALSLGFARPSWGEWSVRDTLFSTWAGLRNWHPGTATATHHVCRQEFLPRAMMELYVLVKTPVFRPTLF